MYLIYVMAPDENGPSKIGITQDLAARLAAVQIGSWLPLRVYFSAYALRVDEKRYGALALDSVRATAFELERHALRALKEMDLRLHGEWCDVTPAEAEAVVRKCAEKIGASIKAPTEMAEAKWPVYTGCMGDDNALALVSTSVAINAAFMVSGGNSRSISGNRLPTKSVEASR